MRRSLHIGCAVLIASAGLALSARADVVEVQASRDNTLYEDASGARSNGSGTRLFVGRNGQNLTRRGLIAFDVAGSVPAGAKITDVSLSLQMRQTNAGDESVTLHRVSADWGEGASVGSGGGGPSMDGDATWIHTFFDSAFWNSPGGDFVDRVSGTAIVGDPGPYTWSSPEMAADVQAWLDAPSSAFGWILVGNETGPTTAKAFAAREDPDEASRPILSVRFDSTAGVPATSRTGVLLMALLVLTGATLLLRRRRLLS